MALLHKYSDTATELFPIFYLIAYNQFWNIRLCNEQMLFLKTSFISRRLSCFSLPEALCYDMRSPFPNKWRIMFNPRILRRRWVLAIVFIFSLAYFVLNIYKQVRNIWIKFYKDLWYIIAYINSVVLDFTINDDSILSN